MSTSSFMTFHMEFQIFCQSPFLENTWKAFGIPPLLFSAGALSIGKPNKRLLIGQTEFTEEEILEFIQKMADGPYREGTYDLFEHNCIYFSEDVIRHLTGKSIPEEILHLPSEILSTPIGQVVKPAVEGILQVMNRESQLVKEIRRVVYGAGSGKRSISAALRRLAYQRPG
uniref:Desumoylating isopeptidase 1 n=1 Tax=Schistocephalus solidus TaxID=70667 RepID=A0A0X3PM09_SCHSO